MSQVREDLLGWLHHDEPHLHYRPVNGGWSSLQVLEHIMLTSHFLLIIIDKGAAKAKRRALTMPVQEDWENYSFISDALNEVAIHKSFSWERPLHMEPTGNLSLGEVRENVRAQFVRCEAYLELLKHGEGTLYLTTMTVNGIGKLDVYQYIYFLILHAKRHLTQLQRNKDEFAAGR
ncbi:DinB family protein [Dawidia soli]|uniref:DinB family protein n=1 Tax=Dawidia soli TaxID=2782352 RepID=A0AAP2DHI0_9BACT|nr:DinB family protein [Dawidia soli]MBT1689472.1 DinB family protein [Dawidia soli]